MNQNLRAGLEMLAYDPEAALVATTEHVLAPAAVKVDTPPDRVTVHPAPDTVVDT